MTASGLSVLLIAGASFLAMLGGFRNPLDLASRGFRQAQSGVSYTIRVTTRTSGTGDLPTNMGAETGNWTGTAVSVSPRSRIDIIDGALSGFFSKGDYILFDASDAITVRPEDKSFKRLLPIDQDSISRLTNLASGTFTLSSPKVTLDSLLPSEVLSGKQTSRYRVRFSFVATIDVSSFAGLEAIPPRSFEIEQTTDYYYAHLPELPQVALAGGPASPPQLLAPSHHGELAVQLAAANSKLPKDKLSLRTVATTQIEGGGISSLRETTTEITQIRSGNVDIEKLRLPSDYKPALEASAAASAVSEGNLGEKWRRPPST